VHKHHGAENNAALLDALAGARVKPGLMVHGHDHLGMSARVSLPRSAATADAMEPLPPPPAPTPPTLPKYNVSYDQAAPALRWPRDCASADRVEVPVHNPGSGALDQCPPGRHSSWHRQAGYNLYTVRRDPEAVVPVAPHAEAQARAGGYACGDAYDLSYEHFVHDGERVKPNMAPYVYLRNMGKEK
jgi:hypothetical protein